MDSTRVVSGESFPPAIRAVATAHTETGQLSPVYMGKGIQGVPGHSAWRTHPSNAMVPQTQLEQDRLCREGLRVSMDFQHGFPALGQPQELPHTGCFSQLAPAFLAFKPA